MSTAKTKLTRKITPKKTGTSADFLNQQLSQDTRNALLIVSLAINALVLTTWLVLETTNRYNAEVISYLSR